MDDKSTRGTTRTMMRVMQRKSVGMVAVYEQELPAPETAGRVLVFEARTGKTQVASFPPDWPKLSDDELATIRRAAS